MTGSETRREILNIAILVVNQTLFMVAAITVMTLSGVVGGRLSDTPSLATLPIALTMVGAVVSTLPASLFMKRVGRRPGFLVGALLGGLAGSLLSFWSIVEGTFIGFCLGNLLVGLYQGFAMYYRFAAADVARPAIRSRAISWVMAGGVAAAFLGPWNASANYEWLTSVPDGGPYLVMAFLAVLASLLLALLRVPPQGEPQADDVVRPMRDIAGQGRFKVAVLASAVGYAIMILVMTATPLAMLSKGFEMGQVATIMQWHVLGMFVPSFFTGSLIARLGLYRVLMAGAGALLLSSATAASGESFAHFWVALVLLGIGWNFLFVGGSVMLAGTHSESERGKVQGINDLIVLSLVAIGSLLAGTLFHLWGWMVLNLTMVPLVIAVVVALCVWQIRSSAPAVST
ncbi:MFS transporter [Marinimicrobium sp. LS-A18]|uniref:MFS transporter n=1 Tax=Marinimicrobium sp. LS-A18 TaxID=1381596 RepID=UPI000463AD52|nr:MFS transporter [Marinimicrobium sp. LS-A18]